MIFLKLLGQVSRRKRIDKSLYGRESFPKWDLLNVFIEIQDVHYITWVSGLGIHGLE